MYEVLRCASTTDTRAKYFEHLVISIEVLGLIRDHLHLNKSEHECDFLLIFSTADHRHCSI